MLTLPFTVPFPVPENLTQHLNQMKLSVRSAGCLLGNNHTVTAELALISTYALLKYKNFGRKSFNQVADELEHILQTKLSRNHHQLMELPGADVLMRRLGQLHITPELHEKVSRLVSAPDWPVRNPTLVAVVLTPLTALSANEHAQMNAALGRLGLRLNMQIGDIWVQQSTGLSDEQLAFLYSTLKSAGFSEQFMEWMHSHRFDPSPVAFACTVLEAWARIRLSRNHPHRAEMEAKLRTVNLGMESDIPFEDVDYTNFQRITGS